MSVYTLCNNVSAVQVLPIGTDTGTAPANLPAGSIASADFAPAGALNTSLPPSDISFQVIVRSTQSGANVSATVQPLASNDGIHWVGFMAAITVATGASPNSGFGSSSVPYRFYSAYVQTIGGTSPRVDVLMFA